MEIDPLQDWAGLTDAHTPLLIAGPCSAETPEQLYTTCKALHAQDINWMRAGVWKPRTRPNNFEGIGQDALQWITDLKQELPVQFAIEVATPEHVELALKHDIDMLWIGARSTVNPFTVQAIADSLKGVDIPVLVKNPVNPDMALWLGAIERLHHAGTTKLGAIHRGFSSFQKSKYRNVPSWHIPIEMKRRLPALPMICDPSHIAGTRDLIEPLCQQALDLNYDGLMVETHYRPDEAWSDAKQQVTPERLQEIRHTLKVRQPEVADSVFQHNLDELRHSIDQCDHELLEVLHKRMELVQQVGEYKQRNNVTIFQLERWNEVFKSRPAWAAQLGIDGDFIKELFKLVHIASIKQQTEVMNNHKATEQANAAQ